MKWFFLFSKYLLWIGSFYKKFLMFKVSVGLAPVELLNSPLLVSINVFANFCRWMSSYLREINTCQIISKFWMSMSNVNSMITRFCCRGCLTFTQLVPKRWMWDRTWYFWQDNLANVWIAAGIKCVIVYLFDHTCSSACLLTIRMMQYPRFEPVLPGSFVFTQRTCPKACNDLVISLHFDLSF